MAASGLASDACLQALQPVHHGAQLGKIGVVLDEERQSLLHLAECRCRLHHRAERDGAGKEAGRRDDEGEDDGELIVGDLVEGKLRLGEQHPPAVGKDVGEALVQGLGLALLAAVERDALGILTHAHQGEAEVGLEALPLEVERDQPPPDQVCEEGADDGVDQARPGHVAGNRDVEANRRQRQRPREVPQDEQERDQRHDRGQKAQQELHGVFAKQPQILGDALVGIVDRALQLDAIVAAPVQPVGEIPARQPASPAQAQVGADDGARDTDRDEAGRQRPENGDLPPKSGFVLVLQAVVEAPIPVVEQHFQPDGRKGQRDGADQQRDGDPALFRLEVGHDQPPPVADERANFLH